MPVTPNEILGSAIALGGGEAEVDWRNACSRAYFAAFHRCRQVAEAYEPHVETGGSNTHRIVGEILTERSRGPEVIGMGYMLGQCRRLRNRADYDVEEVFDRTSCDSAIQTSESILERADAIGSSEPPVDR